MRLKLSENIKKFRKERKMTQEQLAEDIDNIMVGYANVFFQRKNYDATIDCLRWLRIVLRGIQPERSFIL